MRWITHTLTNVNRYVTIGLFFLPFIFRWSLGSSRAFLGNLRQRPPPQSIPSKASRALNLLFVSAIVALILSFPNPNYASIRNIFEFTGSSFNSSSETILSRLRSLVKDNLSETDILLLSKLGSQSARETYLRYGADSLISCSFCTFENPFTFVIFWIARDVLVPHCLHYLVLGLATSKQLCGIEASRWRIKFVAGGLLIPVLELFYFVARKSDFVTHPEVTPFSLSDRIKTIRLISITIYDGLCAAILYLSATNRLFYKVPTDSERLDEFLGELTTSVENMRAKLRVLLLGRSTIVREKSLRDHDAAYWDTLAVDYGAVDPQKEGVPSSPSLTSFARGREGEILQSKNDDVSESMGRVSVNGQEMAISRLAAEAKDFVDEGTRGLDTALQD